MEPVATGVNAAADAFGATSLEGEPGAHGIRWLNAARLTLRRFNGGAAFVLALTVAFAWLVPFDIRFTAPPLGLPPIRAAAIALLALAGAALGRRIGLSVEGPARGRPARDALIAAVAVAVWCALCDWIWRPSLHPAYVTLLTTTPLAFRIALFAMRALNENILYRLFLGPLLILILGSVWKGSNGRPAPGAYWAGFTLSQMVNIWSNTTAIAPLTPEALLHDLLRYVAPGVVWGWLYWRRGFAATELASTSVHLFFQPLVVLGL
jgi:hypothetical protein